MKLFLIERTGGPARYEEIVGHVIAAADENRARQIAADSAPANGEDAAPWLDSSHTAVRLLGTAVRGTRPGVILTSQTSA